MKTKSKKVETLGYYHGENSVKKLGDINKRTPEYNAWRNMHKRCTYKRPDIFDNRTYLENKISVCKRWRKDQGIGYINFLNDLGRKPSPNHSLERTNNKRNYTPKNCVWALPKEQARNTSRTQKFVAGKKYGKLKLVEELNLNKPGRWVVAECKCGSAKIYSFRMIYNKVKKSCGCDKKTRKRTKK